MCVYVVSLETFGRTRAPTTLSEAPFNLEAMGILWPRDDTGCRQGNQVWRDRRLCHGTLDRAVGMPWENLLHTE